MDPQAHQIRDLSLPDANTEKAACQAAAHVHVQFHSLIAWTWQAGMSIPQRLASDHLIIHVESGALSADINGLKHNITAGQMLWVSKGALRSVHARKTSQFIASHLDIMHQAGIQIAIPAVSTYEINDVTYLKQLLQYQSPEHQAHLRLAGDFFQHYLRQSLIQQNTLITDTEQNDDVIHKVLDLLEQDPALSAEQCAQYSGLGITRFRQRFNQCCGISPGKYITQLRIRIAANLLRNTDRPISEIAIDCGYENPNYLYRAFKRIHHCTPHAYRSGEITSAHQTI